jgi:hypothetical protein
VPHAKQVGKGWKVWPGYDDEAAAAASGATGSTSASVRSTRCAVAIGAPPNDAVVTPASAVTSSAVSRGGGWRSDTSIGGQLPQWSSGASA